MAGDSRNLSPLEKTETSLHGKYRGGWTHVIEGTIVDCTWGARKNQWNLCTEVEFIVAFICDKCGDKKTIDLCSTHYSQWKDEYKNLRCTHCNGTLSWKARTLSDSRTEHHINLGPDDD